MTTADARSYRCAVCRRRMGERGYANSQSRFYADFGDYDTHGLFVRWGPLCLRCHRHERPQLAKLAAAIARLRRLVPVLERALRERQGKKERGFP